MYKYRRNFEMNALRKTANQTTCDRTYEPLQTEKSPDGTEIYDHELDPSINYTSV